MRFPKYRAWEGATEQMHSVVLFGKNTLTLSTKGIDNLSFTDMVIKDTLEVELMQWSGLSDCNGLDVFSGDIVIDNNIESKPRWLSVVHFDESLLSWVLLSISAEGKRYMKPYVRINTKDYDKKLEVIGNIYEDKQLLRMGNKVD